MGAVIISYDSLMGVSKSAHNSSEKLRNYANSLEKRVISKMNSLSGGKNSNINNADYYTRAKIKKLNSKSNMMQTFSDSVKSFIEYAKDKDQNVANKLSDNSKQFKKNHDYIKDNWWTRLQGWLVDLKNSCPLFEAIGDLLNGMDSYYQDMKRRLRYWYEVGGGKQTLKIVFAAVGVIVSAVLLACAILIPGVNIIFAICGIVGAVIGVLNAITSLVTAVQAKQAHDQGDPAWSKVYSDRDTLSKALRENRWTGKMKWLNKSSYAFADILDVTQLVCDIVGVVECVTKIGQIGKTINRLHNMTGKSRTKYVFKYIFNSKFMDGVQDFIKPDRLKNLTQIQKNAKNVKKVTKVIKRISSYTEKHLNYVNGGDHSASNAYSSYKDIVKDFLTDRYNILDGIDKMHNKVMKKAPNVYKNVNKTFEINKPNIHFDLKTLLCGPNSFATI